MHVIRSIAQAFEALRLLSDGQPRSLSQISRDIELSPSSTLNILRSLIAEGAIFRDASSKQFVLVPAWQAFESLRDTRERRISERARPLMKTLADAREAAVGLWKQVSADRLMLIVHAESDSGTRLRLADAQRQPLGSGAVGRALAAAQRVDRHELARRYEAVRWRNDLPFDTYIEQVEEAQRHDYAIDREFTHRSIVSVAVGATGPDLGYCLSCSILAGSASEDEIRMLIPDLHHLRTQLFERK